jgi:hypothetical protein
LSSASLERSSGRILRRDIAGNKGTALSVVDNRDIWWDGSLQIVVGLALAFPDMANRKNSFPAEPVPEIEWENHIE